MSVLLSCVLLLSCLLRVKWTCCFCCSCTYQNSSAAFHNVSISRVFSIRACIACLLYGVLHIMLMHIVCEVRSTFGRCHLLPNFYIQSLVDNVFIAKVEAILLEKCVLLTERHLQEITKQNPIVLVFNEN